MATKYTIATDLVSGLYIDKLGVYDDPADAIKAADVAGQGYKVYTLSKVLYYQQNTPSMTITKAKSKICQVAKEMTDRIVSGIKAGEVWVYSNIGTSGTFTSAIKNNNFKTNCATLSNWILRKLKITSSGERFYGKAGGTIHWSNVATEDAVYHYCDVFKVGKTVKECLDQKILLPGDICCYAHQHTNIYAGKNKWYESGSVYADGSAKEGLKLSKYYGNTVLYDWEISWVIRYKDPNMTDSARQYRVQCGEYKLKDNANNMKAKLINNGFDAKIVKIGSYYIVQTGVFSIISNAVNYANRIIEAGLPCIIMGIN